MMTIADYIILSLAIVVFIPICVLCIGAAAAVGNDILREIYNSWNNTKNNNETTTTSDASK